VPIYKEKSGKTLSNFNELARRENRIYRIGVSSAQFAGKKHFWRALSPLLGG
jgi:hypothetical protein